MSKFPIGVMLDSFRAGFESGLQKAAAVGAQGVQVYAIRGELAPENLTPEQVRGKKNAIDAAGLVVSALCGDLGGHGFVHAADNPGRIERSKRILDLALQWDCKVITTHIGVVPENPQEERYKILQEACRQMGGYAEQFGAVFAIETGPERAVTLKKFLDSLGVKGVGVNYDPANLVMVTCDDPVAGVYTLRDYIVHTHAKDGRNLRRADPRVVYGLIAENEEESLNSGAYFEELPLGEGHVDFDAYIAALDAVGYHGFLTIEREVGDNPEADIAKAVAFLREKTEPYKSR